MSRDPSIRLCLAKATDIMGLDSWPFVCRRLTIEFSVGDTPNIAFVSGNSLNGVKM